MLLEVLLPDVPDVLLVDEVDSLAGDADEPLEPLLAEEVLLPAPDSLRLSVR